MYCNFTKSCAFPLVSRVSSQPKCFTPCHSPHSQSLPNGFRHRTLESLQRHRFKQLSNGLCRGVPKNSSGAKPRNFSNGSPQKSLENGCGSKSRNFFCGFSEKGLGSCDGTNPGYFSVGFHKKLIANSHGIKVRSFSNGSHLKATENDGGVRPRKTLPWIASSKNREFKGSEKAPAVKTSRSSWEDSANIYFSKNGTKPKVENSESSSKPSNKIRGGSSSWEAPVDVYSSKNKPNRSVENTEGSTMPSTSSRGSRPIEVTSVEKYEDEEVIEDVEPVDDPRWDRIKTKYERIINRETRTEKPEIHRWDKQEKWGRKTWKEGTESTVPKLVGEGVYGVGPVLAALTVGRREFYTLYVQEGLDLSNNNRKKKDKKGFERVLKRAEKIGLTVKEASKHDLNMVVDNRPHQGLVLDASPLDMANVRELVSLPIEGDKNPVWVALDEVTDPQNLGAIIRSAYFFGAVGVVLCAKNSAPLSGVVSKASAGSLELIELRSCKNMMQFLTNSIENGWRVLGGSVSSRALPLNEVEAGAPTILVLGSEGSGLRPLVEKSCTQLIRIPGNIPLRLGARDTEGEEIEGTDGSSSTEEFGSFMAVESLNVSVAAGVLLYHLVGNSKCSLGDKQIDALD